MNAQARIAAERGIAAQALKDSDHRAQVVAAGLSPELFHDEYARKVFTAQADGVDLGDDAALIAAGLIEQNYIDLTRDDMLVVAQFVANLAAVVAGQLQDRRQAVADRILNGDDVAQVAADVLALDMHTTRKAGVLEKLEARRLRASSPPPEPVTRLFLAGKPIATPGNLVTLIAKSKTGKTASVGGIIAAPVAAAMGNADVDSLGFTASTPDGKAVILFDSEQSMFDAFTCYMRALNRAGEGTDPAWLHPYGLAGWSCQELRAALRPAMEQAAKVNGGVFAVILDGVADFVSDVNDPQESNAFVAELHGLAIEFDCSVICVIHSNESKMSGDDGRGHLGKQLTRKAESNLLLRKTGDVTTITSEKQRKAPITEADGVAFKWSDEQGRHVSCASAADTRIDTKREKARDMAEAVFAHMSRPSAKYADLVRAIQEMRKVTASTAEDRFTDMKKLGVITKCLATGLWTLNPVTP